MTCVPALAQLAAGSEHMIAGKTVRVNLAGPRPELPMTFLPGQPQMSTTATPGGQPTAIAWGSPAK
jgi:hypothetical protein